MLQLLSNILIQYSLKRNVLHFASDIDECIINMSACPHGQYCVNMIGSYTCHRDVPDYNGEEEEEEEEKEGNDNQGNQDNREDGDRDRDPNHFNCGTGFSFNRLRNRCEGMGGIGFASSCMLTADSLGSF